VKCREGETGCEKLEYLLVVPFFLFFFSFFRNYAFIVLRYKKPHAAVAMEKTKPINQITTTKESLCTGKYPLSPRFLLRRAIGRFNKESTN